MLPSDRWWSSLSSHATSKHSGIVLLRTSGSCTVFILLSLTSASQSTALLPFLSFCKIFIGHLHKKQTLLFFFSLTRWPLSLFLTNVDVIYYFHCCFSWIQYWFFECHNSFSCTIAFSMETITVLPVLYFLLIFLVDFHLSILVVQIDSAKFISD